MALTESKFELTHGTVAPGFSLPDAYGSLHNLKDSLGKITIIVFWCNHCPYVKHLKTHFFETARTKLADCFIYLINSNDFIKYPEDNPEAMRADQEQFGYNIPYLVDETQVVAKAYHAACTPDFFILDQFHKVSYMGRYDGSTPGNNQAVTGQDLLGAIEQIRLGTIPKNQKPAMGCNIKLQPQ